MKPKTRRSFLNYGILVCAFVGVICSKNVGLLSCLLFLTSCFFFRRMRWAGYVARMGETSGVYRVLVGKHEGKKPHGRPRRR